MERMTQMKAVILAGGLGSRLSEETESRPKPMVEVGGYPLLWHIMKIYSAHGINDFVICLGYKGYVIKEFFSNYFLHMADVTFDIAKNKMQVHQNKAEPWSVTLIETGPDTMTGGRLKRIRKYVEDETFCVTYGDGVSDVDITKSIQYHKAHGKLATVTSIIQPGRFGNLKLEDDHVKGFQEKSSDSGSWINGGFFVLEPKALDLIEDDQTIWERTPLETLSTRDELRAFKHHGFWHPVDTLRDKRYLEELWKDEKAPWKIWK